MTASYSPDMQAVCDRALQRIADDDAAGLIGPRRMRDWSRMERDVPVEPAVVAEGEWQDAVADRLYDEPGDPLLDREPMGGDPRWAEGV